MDKERKVRNMSVLFFIFVSSIISISMLIIYYMEVKNISSNELLKKAKIYSEYTTKTIYDSYITIYKYGSINEKNTFVRLIENYIHSFEPKLEQISIMKNSGKELMNSFDFLYGKSNDKKIKKIDLSNYYKSKEEYFNGTLITERYDISNNHYLILFSPYINSNGNHENSVIYVYNLKNHYDKLKITLLWCVGFFVISLGFAFLLFFVFLKIIKDVSPKKTNI